MSTSVSPAIQKLRPETEIPPEGIYEIGCSRACHHTQRTSANRRISHYCIRILHGCIGILANLGRTGRIDAAIAGVYLERTTKPQPFIRQSGFDRGQKHGLKNLQLSSKLWKTYIAHSRGCKRRACLWTLRLRREPFVLKPPGGHERA
jgi:hypothetical protein